MRNYLEHLCLTTFVFCLQSLPMMIYANTSMPPTTLMASTTTMMASNTTSNATYTTDMTTMGQMNSNNITAGDNITVITTGPVVDNVTSSMMNSTVMSTRSPLVTDNVTSPMYANETSSTNMTTDGDTSTTNVPDVPGESNTNSSIVTNWTTTQTPLFNTTAVASNYTTANVNTTTTNPNTTQTYSQTTYTTHEYTQTPYTTHEYTQTPNTTQEYTQTPNTTQEYTQTPNTTNEYTQNPNTTQDYTHNPNTTQEYTQAPNTTQGYTQTPNTTNEYTQNPNTTQEYIPTSNTTQKYTPTPNTTQEYTQNTTTPAANYTTPFNSTTPSSTTTSEYSTSWTSTNITTMDPTYQNMTTNNVFNTTAMTNGSTQTYPSSEPPAHTTPSTYPMSTSSASSIGPSLVIIITDTGHAPVFGSTITLSPHNSEATSIYLKNTSHILTAEVSLSREHNVVIIASKTGYATNAVIWTKGESQDIVVRLAKLREASVNLIDDEILLKTEKNANGHTASIQFSAQSTNNPAMNESNIKASYLLSTNLKVLPDLRSNYANQTTDDDQTLQPYAAIQLTVNYGGESTVAMVMGEFAMVIPVEYNDLEYKDGQDVPAWYFHEIKGVWVRSGVGTLHRDSADVTYWHFTAPHLSWWMAATVVKETEYVDDPLLGEISELQFFIILLIACVGIFGMGAMMVFICIKPKELKGNRQNGSSRSRKDSDTTKSVTNLELKDSNNRESDHEELPPPPPPPTLTIGITNQGAVSDEVAVEITDTETPGLDNYIYTTNLDVSECDAKVMDGYEYTTNSFLNVGGEKPMDTASILDAFASSTEGSVTSDGVPSEGSSQYKENIVV